MNLPWTRDRENENVVVHIDDFIEREKATFPTNMFSRLNRF